MDVTDPLIKSLVCDACWNGLFSVEGWKTVLAGKKAAGHRGYSNGYGYNTTWAALRAASGNCNWCNFLSGKNKHREGGLQAWIACDEDSNCTPAGEKKLSVIVHGENGGFSKNCYFMYTDSDDNAARDVKARDRITDVSTPESYKLALECVQNCQRTHTKCPSVEAATTLLPDRVLDCTNTQKPKLVLTGGKQHDLYIALSYVWGGPQPMTTTANIDEFVTSGLDMSQFPPTIRDAVEATHNLGVRYLWIDALCIMQDSAADKAAQLGAMCRIYRTAYLTLNAACASSTREGFLRVPRPPKVPDARVPYRCRDGSAGRVYIAREMDTDAGDASRSYWDEMEPVAHRAWCLQERLLPPRSLVFASDTLKLVCQTETASIGNALCEPSTGLRLPTSVYRTRDTAEAGGSGDEKDGVACRQAWLATIFMYTIRGLTVASDKLPALGGVAEQFARATGDRYLAGLWRASLLPDLLWEFGDAPRLLPRPKGYRAPSWSWASVDGMIGASFLEPELEAAGAHRREAEVLGCKVELASEDVPFGEVKGGVLRLRGVLRRVVAEMRKGEKRDWGTREALVEGADGKVVKIGVLRLDAEEERPTEMYVVPLVWDARGSFVKGIGVVRVGSGVDEYRRVARFSGSGGEGGASWLDDLDRREIVVV
ncbi:HET-domain-containing protein [Jackrogersella minutella]|nr:HET-domain-containing protein [Jackrogersella minutella]